MMSCVSPRMVALCLCAAYVWALASHLWRVAEGPAAARRRIMRSVPQSVSVH